MAFIFGNDQDNHLIGTTGGLDIYCAPAGRRQ
jgi:hypothetical protein